MRVLEVDTLIAVHLCMTQKISFSSSVDLWFDDILHWESTRS